MVWYLIMMINEAVNKAVNNAFSGAMQGVELDVARILDITIQGIQQQYRRNVAG